MIYSTTEVLVIWWLVESRDCFYSWQRCNKSVTNEWADRQAHALPPGYRILQPYGLYVVALFGSSETGKRARELSKRRAVFA